MTFMAPATGSTLSISMDGETIQVSLGEGPHTVESVNAALRAAGANVRALTAEEVAASEAASAKERQRRQVERDARKAADVVLLGSLRTARQRIRESRRGCLLMPVQLAPDEIDRLIDLVDGADDGP